MIEQPITILDIFVAIFLIALIIVISNFYKNNKLANCTEYKYFTYGLFTKIIGAVALAFVYVFYYGGGDTQYYFRGGAILINTLFVNPVNYFKLLFIDSGNYTVELQSVTNQINYFRSPEEWFMVKIISVINLFSFNRYLISSLYMSLIAFYGSWKMFKTFIYFFPKYHKAAFISVYLLPGVIFWSSGILKDTITFAALGVFFYNIINIFFKNKVNLFYIIMLIFSAFIILKLKAYILFGFLPAVFIGIYLNYRNRIKNNIIRKMLAPILLTIVFSTGYFLILSLINQSNKYRVSTLENRIEGFHSWHTTQGGSSYNLGDVEYTPLGIISKIPASLNVTFFRPYLWEVRNITSLIGAVESFVLILLFIMLLWRYKLKWISLSAKNSFLSLAIIYSIVFGFAVGFTSYNFGALARYKVPVMPFFLFILLYFYYYKKLNTKD